MSAFRVGALFMAPGLTASSPASPRTWHILNDGSGDAPTIQAGVDSAGMGDTVLVGPGTYYENVDSLGNDITLISAQGFASTIIDGSNAGSVIQVIGGAHVEGFTLQDGLNDDGGGIRASLKEGSPTVIFRGNLITNNRAGFQTDSGFGGGIAVANFQSATIES